MREVNLQANELGSRLRKPGFKDELIRVSYDYADDPDELLRQMNERLEYDGYVLKLYSIA